MNGPVSRLGVVGGVAVVGAEVGHGASRPDWCGAAFRWALCNHP